MKKDQFLNSWAKELAIESTISDIDAKKFLYNFYDKAIAFENQLPESVGMSEVEVTMRKEAYHNYKMRTDLAYRKKFYKSSIPLSISEERICEWSNDKDYEYYETSCSEAYCLIDGTLTENKHLYCPYCGGKIKELNNE